MTLTLNMKLTPFKDVKLLRLEECRWKKAKHESLSWQFKTHILLIFYRFRAVWTKNLCNEKSLSFWRIITSVFTVSFRTYTTCLWTKKPTQKMKKTNKTKLKNIEVLKKLHNLREKCTRWLRQCRRKRADSSDIKCLQAATGMAVCHRYQKPPPMLKNYTTKLVWFKWRNNKAVQKKKKPLRSCRDKEAATRTQQGARIRSSSWGRRRWLVPPARCQHQNLRYEGQTVGGLGEEALLYKGDLQLDSVTRLLAPTIKVLQLTQGGEIEKKMTKYAELIPVLCLTTRKHNREVSPTNCHSWQISHWLFR